MLMNADEKWQSSQKRAVNQHTIAHNNDQVGNKISSHMYISQQLAFYI